MADRITSAHFGFCPQCGAMGVRHEEHQGGSDTCERGHTYPSTQARKATHETRTK